MIRGNASYTFDSANRRLDVFKFSRNENDPSKPYGSVVLIVWKVHALGGKELHTSSRLKQ